LYAACIILRVPAMSLSFTIGYIIVLVGCFFLV
jgi:hypothetical protein